MRLLPYLSFLLLPVTAQTQQAQLSGIINHYAAVTAIDTCAGRIAVSDTTGFRAGETILLIQMQGATISSANNAGFGAITDLNGAGKFERITIDSVAAGALFTRNQWINGYDPAGQVQAVTFPHYENALVTDTLRPGRWNGSTGGILAFSVQNTLTLDAPVVADGAGFRGGAAYVAPENNCTWLLGESDYYYASGGWRGSFKGEGIAIPDTNQVFGRGPQANGGGGGNDHNAGGGGGANTGAAGRGGDNDEPSAFGCDGYFPGLGGKPLNPDTTRLFPGGGGGAGHANNNTTSFGGNGGGIVLIETGRLAGLRPAFSAIGLPGNTANGDGGGGGGAGGTLWLRIGETPDSLQLTANGGPGGHTINNNQNRCFGPGGGGGGGCIRTNLLAIVAPVGAPAGIITGSSNTCAGTTSGAMSGMPGAILPLPAGWPQGAIRNLVPETLAEPNGQTVCTGDPVTFSVVANPGNWQYQWEVNTGSGWMPVSAGMGLEGAQTPALKIPAAGAGQNGYRFRCIVLRPGCFNILSEEAVLQVIPAPKADFEVTLNNTTAVFDNQSQNAGAYWWDFGDGTTSNLPAPQHDFPGEGIYTVTLYAISACDTAVFTQTINLLLAPVAGFSAPDSVIDCEAIEVAFLNQSSINALGFVWLFPGGVPATSTDTNPIITYPVSGTYPVTLIAFNATGSDTVVQEIVVQVLGFPEAEFSYTVLNGLAMFTNLSINADTYTWYFGDNTDPVQTKDALHQYAQGGVFTVTLVVDNFCGTAVLQQTIEIILIGTNTPVEPYGMRVFPNPATDKLVLDTKIPVDEPFTVQIFDMPGRLMLHQTMPAGNAWVLSLQDLPAGAYQLCVFMEKKAFRWIVLRR